MQCIEWCFDLIAAASRVSVTYTTYSVPSPHSESSGTQSQIPSLSTECSCDLSVIFVESHVCPSQCFPTEPHSTAPMTTLLFLLFSFCGIAYVPQKFNSLCAPIHRLCYMFLLKDFFILSC